MPPLEPSPFSLALRLSDLFSRAAPPERSACSDYLSDLSIASTHGLGLLSCLLADLAPLTSLEIQRLSLGAFRSRRLGGAYQGASELGPLALTFSTDHSSF